MSRGTLSLLSHPYFLCSEEDKNYEKVHGIITGSDDGIGSGGLRLRYKRYHSCGYGGCYRGKGYHGG